MGWLNGFATIICILDYVGVWRLDCRIEPHGWRLANHPVKRTRPFRLLAGLGTLSSTSTDNNSLLTSRAEDPADASCGDC